MEIVNLGAGDGLPPVDWAAVAEKLEAIVSLGDLSPADVQVQLLHGPSGQGEELSSPAVVLMEPAGAVDDDHLRYMGSFTCGQAGRYGVTVRIVPAHADLVSPVELGRIAWA